jgi:hypothetical protein
MAGTFDELLSRADSGGAELPETLAVDLIAETVRNSVLLSLARSVPCTTHDNRIPVLTDLPSAYWVVGDAGLKQTTQAKFASQTLIAEEIAAIAPIPESIIADSKYDIWAAVKPLLARACAKKLDDAGLWGLDPPVDGDGNVTWPMSVAETAMAAGAKTAYDADPVDGVLDAARIVSEQGYDATGAAVCNGWQFRASAARSTAVVANPAQGPYPLMIAGLGLRTRPLSWKPRMADAIVACWDNVLVGMRQDITLKLFDSGVISDDTGKVILNLMQQDTVACRVTMRVGFRVVAPPTDVAFGDVKNGLASPAALTALSPVALVGSSTAERSDTGCATTIGDATVTDSHAVATDAGLFISGTNIPAGTVIRSVSVGVGYELSQKATATASSLTFKVGG